MTSSGPFGSIPVSQEIQPPTLDRYQERCERCGALLYDNPDLRPARLCARHLHEARVAAGPSWCSSADIDAGYPEDPPASPDNLAALSPSERLDVLAMFMDEHRRGEHAEPLAIVGCPSCHREGRVMA